MKCTMRGRTPPTVRSPSKLSLAMALYSTGSVIMVYLKYLHSCRGVLLVWV